MCNLYAVTIGQQAIRELARAMHDTTGNLPPMPAVFPDYAAPVVPKFGGGGKPQRMRVSSRSPSGRLRTTGAA